MTGPGHSHDPAPDIWALRKAALTAAQAHSGNLWTDYNIHDPGVMLLEQIAYAVTEIEYRDGFKMAEKLSAGAGGIDAARQRLASPEAMFQMRPVTQNDLASVLSGCDPSVSQVLVSRTEGAPAGLYDLHVIPSNPEMADTACQAVAAAYAGMRNLCEDATPPRPAKPVPCTLNLSLEYQRRTEPEAILAEALIRAQRLLLNRALPASKDLTPDDAFDDPVRSTPGWQSVQDGARAAAPFYAAIAEIPGVLHVTSIAIRDVSGQSWFDRPATPGSYPHLRFAPDLSGLFLSSRGRVQSLDLGLIQARQAVVDQTGQTRHRLVPPPRPRAESVPMANPVPITAELPIPYLAGPDPVPAYADPETRSAAEQFRGYVAMADALLDETEAGRAAMAALFSEDLSSEDTYADPRGTETAQYDLWFDRKSRILDYLLGLYGETFTQFSLRQFLQDMPQSARERHILENKRRLLRALPQIHRNRAARDGFLTKLEILLDIPRYDADTLERGLRPLGLVAVDALQPRSFAELPENALIPERVADAPASPPSGVFGNGLLDSPTLEAGRDLQNYRIAQSAAGWQLYLQVEDWGWSTCPVAPVGSAAEGAAVATHLSAMLTQITTDAAQAVHGRPVLIEDILLRSSGGFRSGELDIVFAEPDRDAGALWAKAFVEETVHLLCPAHLLPKVHWRTPTGLEELRRCYAAWERTPDEETAAALRRALGGATVDDDAPDTLEPDPS